MNNTKRLATIEAWDQELVTQGSVQLRNDARKLSLAFIGCVVFAFIGLVILLGDPSGGEIVFGGLAVLFFGVIGVPVLIWRIATGSPRVTVTREGVSVGNKTGVAWSDVEEVIGLKVNGARMLALRMRDSDTLDEAVQDSLTARALQPVSNKITGGSDFGIPTGLRANMDALGFWLTSVHERQA